MSTEENPPRLVADPSASSELRDALHAAASVDVDAATRARLSRSLGLPSPPRGGGGGGGVAGGSPAMLKGAIATIAALALVGGAWVALRHRAAPDGSPAPKVLAPIVETSVSPVAAPGESSALPVASAPPSAASTAPPPSRGALASARPKADALPDEAALLRDAREALRDGDPARALTLLDQHAKRFPDGTFAQERDVMRVDALMAEGKTGEAKDAARAFLARHPESAHRPRLEALLSK